MWKTAVLASALILAGCASESGSTETPRAIALSWCERNHPGDAACQRSAMESHVQCITRPGDYDACRERQYGEHRTATK